MKIVIETVVMLGLISAPIAVIAPAGAQPYGHDRDYDRNDRDYDRNGHDYRWHGDRDRDWDPSNSYRDRRDGRRGRGYDRRMTRDDRVYRGRDGRYYCRRNDGTTGLVVGGLGGAAAGGLIGGNTLGALVGAGAGALLGRSIDRGNVHCR